MTSTVLGTKEQQHPMCSCYGHHVTFSCALVLFILIAALLEDKHITITISFHSMKTKAQIGESVFSFLVQSLDMFLCSISTEI